MSKKLHITLIFRNLVVFKTLSSNHRMCKLYTKFIKILEICKQFSENLVNESSTALSFKKTFEFSIFVSIKRLKAIHSTIKLAIS